jgi:hypothetical protein
MNGNGKLDAAVNYVRSFYDTLHKYMDIELYAFGENTYKMTRKELELSFLRDKTESATHPRFQKCENTAHVIVVSDGHFHELPPEWFRKNAHFIFIDSLVDTREYKRRYQIDIDNLIKTMEMATSGIKRHLRGK